MPDWAKFREDIEAGLPNAELLAQLRALEGWLDLPRANALARLDDALKAGPPELLYRSAVVLNLTLQREAGIPAGAESGPALQQLFAEVQKGAATDARKVLAARLGVLWELFGSLVKQFPALNQPPTAADLAKLKLQQDGIAIFQRVDSVADQLAPGTVSPQSIKTYEEVVRDAKALAASASPDNGAMPYVLSMLGGAQRTLAGCYATVGRHADALNAFAAAAADFEKAGEPKDAEDCNSRAADLNRRLSGNLDAAAEKPLEALSAADASDGSASAPSPETIWERLGALMKLSDVAATAADTFEALQYADAAAGTLAGLGYPDPQTSTAQASMDAWVQTASAGSKGTPLLRRISVVCTYYDGILGVRFASLVKKDPAAADATQNLQTELQKMRARLGQEAASAAAESTRSFERYFPPPPETKTEEKQETGDDFETTMDRMRALDAAFIEIQQTCNQRASAGQPMDDLLETAGKLEAQADALKNPLFEAKARLARAYILYQLGRGADLIPVAREARRLLLDGRPPSLSSFAQTFERFYYLDSLNREAMGCIMAGNFEDSLKICEETIRDFETERYRVNSEFRQSALLSYVAGFYTWAAFSAFKLERWDNMLEAIDLIKARSAIRSRLIPDAPQKLDSSLQQEFEQLSAALEKDPQNEDLKTRRRQLWDLQSIARAQGVTGTQAPVLTVESLQSALEEDEALIGYFWLAETVILTIAVDHERFQAKRIALKPDELARLQRFVKFIQQLTRSHDMDSEVAWLGEVLLPAFLRDFIRTKRRITLSPHHSLHLFPFHAARWDNAGFVGTEFAVGYVPNFSSVLLPWALPVENRVLAIGIRDFANHYATSLENVEDDAAAIAGYYRANGAQVETALGTEATRQRMEDMRNQGKLRKFRCVHLGTHGLSVFETPNQPLESRLLVQDGPLDAMDIANLGLNAELVMLSACHSGQRAIELRDLGEVPGDDIFGLQSALFKSGVRSIAGTLWLVETDSASPITRAFHKYYAEGKPAELALQLSVKEYLLSPVDDLDGVYYWAPYFISSIGRRQSKKGESWQN